MRLFVSPWKLAKMGVLGMNARNGDYISLYNSRKNYPYADNKILTKKQLLAHGVSVPELYGIATGTRELKHIEQFIGPHQDFVVKPARGSGGEGILVIVGRVEDQYVRANGEVVNLDYLRHHFSRIFHGLYSLGGQADQAIVEYRVEFDPVFSNVTYRGVPDIRIIVFRGFPLVAMLRLPTKSSNGRANLHQGAVGAGVSIKNGVTHHGVQKGSVCTQHPDTGHNIEGIVIPQWGRLLELAVRCQEIVGLGYLGVDIVLDRSKGPMILEVNARPGLAVQIANQAGLLTRLRAVEKAIEYPEGRDYSSLQERIAFSGENFG